jgi:predicted nucleotidyltransferase
VRRLAIFGSAVTDRFNEERSDVDFLAGCAH